MGPPWATSGAAKIVERMESSVRLQPGAKQLLQAAHSAVRPPRTPAARPTRCEWATALSTLPLRSTSGLPVGPQCQNTRSPVRNVSSSAVSVPDDVQSPVNRAEQSRADLDETFETSSGMVGPVDESEAEVMYMASPSAPGIVPILSKCCQGAQPGDCMCIQFICSMRLHQGRH